MAPAKALGASIGAGTRGATSASLRAVLASPPTTGAKSNCRVHYSTKELSGVVDPCAYNEIGTGWLAA